MLPAEVKKKLGRALACSVCHEESGSESYFGFEDVLTSNVFGALRYLEPRYGLEPVLSDLDLGPIVSANVEFWPNADGCEPDVEIDLGHTIVIVETKLKALFGPDQLPREVIFAHRRANGRPWRLLCVTDHVREPLHHKFSSGGVPLKSSSTSLGKAVATYFEYSDEKIDLTPAEIGERILWTSWSKIAESLENSWRRLHPPPHAHALISDLLATLEARGLTRLPFHGFTNLQATSLEWSQPSLWAPPIPSRPELAWAIPSMTGEWGATLLFTTDRRFDGFLASALAALGQYKSWFARKDDTDG